MRAPLRLLALSITALAIGSVLLSHYKSSVYSPSSAGSSTWSRPTWASLHPTKWLSSFHSGGAKAEVEEQWRMKEELHTGDEEDDKPTSLGSAGGSGEDDMSDDQRAKALERLKHQYGDDDSEKAAESIDWQSVVVPGEGKSDSTSSKSKAIGKNKDKDKGEADVSTTTSSSVSSSSSTSSSSSNLKTSSVVANATAAGNSSSSAPTTLKTVTSTPASSVSTTDEFAYLSGLTEGPQPTSTSAYDHLDAQALNTGLETHLAAADATSTSSTSASTSSSPSSSHSVSSTSSSSTASSTDDLRVSEEAEKAAFDYLEKEVSSTSKGKDDKSAGKNGHAWEDLRDLGAA